MQPCKRHPVLHATVHANRTVNTTVLSTTCLQAFSLVDDFGFEGQAFVGVLPAVMRALTAMLKDRDELDTQTQVGRLRACQIKHDEYAACSTL